jgi:serine-type D-Ala-D-Ala carboxypeptidase/endopeptidase (penicillin-binding protein 4)
VGRLLCSITARRWWTLCLIVLMGAPLLQAQAAKKKTAPVRRSTAAATRTVPRSAASRRPAARAAAPSATRTTKKQPAARPANRRQAPARTAAVAARRKGAPATVRRPAKAAVVRRAPQPVAPPPTPLLARAPFGVDGLRTDLGFFADSSVRSGLWGIMVVSLSHGDTLFTHNPDSAQLPASTQKLLTSVLALNTLGPQYRFRTQILRSGPLTDGKLTGDLILRGDGDPSLSTRFFGRVADTPMDSIVARVVRAGVREVSGQVIGDATAFETRSIPDGWHPRILQDAYAGRVSALSLNENLVWVTVRPTTRGAPAEAVLEPATTAIPLRVAVRTVAGSGATLRRTRNSAGISVTGTIGADAGPKSYSYIVEDPASFTTGAFLAALRRNGVTVAGGMTMGRAPTDAEPVASWESPPLETLLTVMNRESVNPIAEHVLRAAARGPNRSTLGAATNADTALRALLQRSAGVRLGSTRSSDGSGLSQLDRVTARSMVQLLGWADRSSWGPLLHMSLPLAGESGTLRNRMIGTAAQTNLHAKTGTTNDVIALAGYVTARNGELLAFATLYNGNDRWRSREAIDAIGVTLANWSR